MLAQPQPLSLDLGDGQSTDSPFAFLGSLGVLVSVGVLMPYTDTLVGQTEKVKQLDKMEYEALIGRPSSPRGSSGFNHDHDITRSLSI